MLHSEIDARITLDLFKSFTMAGATKGSNFVSICWLIGLREFLSKMGKLKLLSGLDASVVVGHYK